MAAAGAVASSTPSGSPSEGSLGRAARSALDTVATMAPYARQTYTSPNGVVYPDVWPAGDLSDALKNSAQLIRANVGTEVIAIDYGSWDMHTDVGRVDGGDMQRMLDGFAACVTAFLDDLGGPQGQGHGRHDQRVRPAGRRERWRRTRPRLGQHDAARRRGRPGRPVLREVAGARRARPRRGRPQGHHRLPQRAGRGGQASARPLRGEVVPGAQVQAAREWSRAEHVGHRVCRTLCSAGSFVASWSRRSHHSCFSPRCWPRRSCDRTACPRRSSPCPRRRSVVGFGWVSDGSPGRGVGPALAGPGVPGRGAGAGPPLRGRGAVRCRRTLAGEQ